LENENAGLKSKVSKLEKLSVLHKDNILDIRREYELRYTALENPPGDFAY